MAWCVGSVFPTPDLLTGPVFDSLLLDALDSPQHLLDTGCTFHYETYPEAEPHRQVEGFLENCREAFFPKDLLCQNLQEDVSSRLKGSPSCANVGNRLEGIENREGTLQLFFPVGENIDRVGSCLLSLESDSSKKICRDDGIGMHYSSSSSVCQPILQIAANKVEPSWGSKLACYPLAVRTPYQVHWLTSQLQNDDISLVSRGAEHFDFGTSHVAWNPHLPGEAAVVLKNGDVSVFDVSASKSNVASFRFKMEESRMEDTHQTLGIKRKRGKFIEPKFETSTKCWWSCEYAWHPRYLLIGGGTEIDLIDLRQKAGSKQFQCSLAHAPSATRLFSNCNAMHKTEHYTALARGTQDDMFQFAAASTNHLILYDVRQPKTPLLQWEHRMQREPPGLLQMSYFSDARSRLCNAFEKHLAGGRVIIACAFRSGEIQAFPYGPQPHTHPQNTERHMGDMGISEKLFSWGFPVKLTTQKVHSDKNLEHVFEAHGNNLRNLLPTDCGVERLAGLINSSIYSGSSSFTLLQLAGSGAIVSQSLHVMEEQGLSTGEQSLPSSHKTAFTRTSTGSRGTKNHRMEYMPAFLNYMQDESVLSEFRQRAFLSDMKSPTIKEVAQNEALEDQQPTDYSSPLQDQVLSASSTRSDEGGQSSEVFFRELDSQLSSVNLSFNGTDATLQSEEEVLLSGLRNLLQKWQQSFQPYFTHSNLDSKKAAQACDHGTLGL